MLDVIKRHLNDMKIEAIKMKYIKQQLKIRR